VARIPTRSRERSLCTESPASRSILGFMNEMAVHCDYAVAGAGGLSGCDVGALNHRLRRTLHNRGGDYVSPLELVAQRLGREHWERGPRRA
jgi:hypothetical protein